MAGGAALGKKVPGAAGQGASFPFVSSSAASEGEGSSLAAQGHLCRQARQGPLRLPLAGQCQCRSLVSVPFKVHIGGGASAPSAAVGLELPVVGL